MDIHKDRFMMYNKAYSDGYDRIFKRKKARNEQSTSGLQGSSGKDSTKDGGKSKKGGRNPGRKHKKSQRESKETKPSTATGSRIAFI